MKLKVFHISYLCLCYLFIPNLVSAELSVTNQWRIEQAIQRCNQAENSLTYTEYWGDSVTEENRETVCIAEQFSELAAFEGEGWLDTKAALFIKECRKQSNKNDTKYYACLDEGLKAIIGQLSSSCGELGREGLWDTDRCKHLVSYIFLKNFDKVLAAHRPLIKKMMDFKLLRFLFNPIIAITFLILFVLDIVVLIDPGNWVRISKVVLIVGTVILVSLFLERELRFLGAGIAVLMTVGVITMNHLIALFHPEQKEKKKRAITIKKLLR